MNAIFTKLKEAGAEQVAAVKTTDGKLFDDAADALTHQKALNLKEAFRAFAAEHFYNGMSKDDYADVFVENFDELSKIVSGA